MIETSPKILDRLRKLLALSRDSRGSSAEVESAARMATELMQQHRLTELDVGDVSNDGSALVDLPAGKDGFMASWKFGLVTATARAFFCEAVGLRIGQSRKVRIVGRRDDAAVVLVVFKHLVTEIERLVEEDAKSPTGAAFVEFNDGYGDTFISVERATSNVSSRERRNAYRSGLASGVSSTLRDQAKKFKVSSEKALVLTRKSEAELRDYVSNKFAAPRETVHDAGDAVRLPDFERGYYRGKEISVSPDIKTAIEGKKGSE